MLNCRENANPSCQIVSPELYKYIMFTDLFEVHVQMMSSFHPVLRAFWLSIIEIF